MTVYLVRHGESDWNAAGIRHRREDRPLTALGIEQARKAATLLPSGVMVLSSPLVRAYATACLIASELGSGAPQVALDLTEREWGVPCEAASRSAAHTLAAWDGVDVVAVTHAGIIKGLTGSTVTPANGSVTVWRP